MKKDVSLKTKTAKKIIKEIEFSLYTQENSTFFIVYSNWYCGITNSPNVRKSGYKKENNKKPSLWRVFNARSVKVALAIEAYFHKKGMLERDNKEGYKEYSRFVYIFKKHPTIED